MCMSLVSASAVAHLSIERVSRRELQVLATAIACRTVITIERARQQVSSVISWLCEQTSVKEWVLLEHVLPRNVTFCLIIIANHCIKREKWMNSFTFKNLHSYAQLTGYESICWEFVFSLDWNRYIIIMRTADGSKVDENKNKKLPRKVRSFTISSSPVYGYKEFTTFNPRSYLEPLRICL